MGRPEILPLPGLVLVSWVGSLAFANFWVWKMQRPPSASSPSLLSALPIRDVLVLRQTYKCTIWWLFFFAFACKPPFNLISEQKEGFFPGLNSSCFIENGSPPPPPLATEKVHRASEHGSVKVDLSCYKWKITALLGNGGGFGLVQRKHCDIGVI